MKDFDWRRLAQEHDRDPGRDDAEWLDALVAMDEDPAERELALDAEPLLLFRDMGGPEVTSSDVEAMKASVASLRRASETLAENGDQRFASRRRRVVAAWPLAALLALALSAAVLTGSRDLDSSAVATSPAAGRVAYFSAAPGSADSPSFGLAAASFAARELPLVEEADPTSDLLMQIEDDDLSLVVVLTGDQDV